MIRRYQITPVPKPRQTRADRWKKRPAVVRYRNFADDCKVSGVHVPLSGSVITFAMPMPKSWSKSKRQRMAGEPHQQKPDLDNLVKALFDAVYQDDCQIWQFSAKKIWTDGPGWFEVENTE